MIIHIYDMSAWTEEWKSDDYGTRISVEAFDAVNDHRNEILVMVEVPDPDNQTTLQKLEMLDPDTHKPIWTSPALPQMEDYFTDLYGSPQNEIAFLVADQDESGQAQTTRLIVFNDTTYEEAWRSEVIDGSGYLTFQGDFDSDGRGEVMLATTVFSANRTSSTTLTVFEFVEEPPAVVDLAVQAGDITLSDPAPLAGTVQASNGRKPSPNTSCACPITMKARGSASRTNDLICTTSDRLTTQYSTVRASRV